MKKKSQHGGARRGAGRKKSEETKVIRVPVSTLEKIDAIVAEAKAQERLSRSAQ